MRILVLTRGLPGSGKSTWINRNNLDNYTISTDRLRLLYASPVLDPDGQLHISQKVNKDIFDNLFHILDYRMKNGDFTVVDACHLRECDLIKYKKLVDLYRYRTIMIDFTGISLEECIRRNASRKPPFVVPEYALRRMYSFLNEKVVIPKWIKVYSPDDSIELFC